MKKILKWSFISLGSLILLLGLIVLFSFLNSGQLGRYVIYGNADIDDYKIFPSRSIDNSASAFTFYRAAEEKAPDSLKVSGKKVSFDKFLELRESVAFLAIRNDTILYERYFSGYEETSIIPSFSMAKAITSILIGCAIDDGLIGSVEEPMVKYIPELNRDGFEKIKIKHLLQMTSGIAFEESYSNPFGDAASIYYGNDLRDVMEDLKIERPAGEAFHYMSGNTQLLGLILENVLKGKTITDYLEERIWQPLGMEYEASWSVDRKKDGLEKTFCCLNARTRDFAKIGRLYLNKGNWNGKQIISEDWVNTSTKVDSLEGSDPGYQYQWWLPSQNGDYMAEGLYGQYIYINPAENLIIVRLGKEEARVYWPNVFKIYADAGL